MPKVAKQIHCSESERIELHKIVNSQKAEHRIVRRAKMVLLCLDGMQIKDIASKLGERPNTVSLWRDRFAEQGIPGLQDKKRRGRTAQYGPEFREMVLNKLKETPPSGLARWDGPTLARVLNVSKAAVWRLMRKEGIQLARQRSWCGRVELDRDGFRIAKRNARSIVIPAHKSFRWSCCTVIVQNGISEWPNRTTSGSKHHLCTLHRFNTGRI